MAVSLFELLAPVFLRLGFNGDASLLTRGLKLTFNLLSRSFNLSLGLPFGDFKVSLCSTGASGVSRDSGD